jgi:hypothetical protein
MVSNFPFTWRGCCSVLSFIWQRPYVELMLIHQVNLGSTALLKKGVLNQHTFYVQKTTHLKVCYSSTPLGVLFACPENNTPLGVF